MIYNDREVIFIDYEHNQIASFNLSDGLIGIAVSGGLDSTTLLYAICKYITDLNLNIQILPIHHVDKYLSNSLVPTQIILEEVMRKYPKIEILDLEVNFYDGGNYFEDSDIKRYNKLNAMNSFYEYLHKKYTNLNIIITALTGLPSYEIVKKWKCGINHDRVQKLFPIYEYTENNICIYNPFAECNKKLISNIFYYLKLPEKYLTETWSCTFYSHQTKNFTEPCGKCYHCWEKKWAFGQF
jgi:3'-phosphoadenosine 5'-phosphosulfate sulfotransferase (PAPS reductase)/FAD synthetase